jgi:hypothetical protein
MMTGILKISVAPVRFVRVACYITQSALRHRAVRDVPFFLQTERSATWPT